MVNRMKDGEKAVEDSWNGWQCTIPILCRKVAHHKQIRTKQDVHTPVAGSSAIVGLSMSVKITDSSNVASKLNFVGTSYLTVWSICWQSTCKISWWPSIHDILICFAQHPSLRISVEGSWELRCCTRSTSRLCNSWLRGCIATIQAIGCLDCKKRVLPPTSFAFALLAFYLCISLHLPFNQTNNK